MHSLSVFDLEVVLPLDLHVAHDVRTPFLAPLDLFKLGVQVQALLDKLSGRHGQSLLLKLVGKVCLTAFFRRYGLQKLIL